MIALSSSTVTYINGIRSEFYQERFMKLFILVGLIACTFTFPTFAAVERCTVEEDGVDWIVKIGGNEKARISNYIANPGVALGIP